MAYADCGLEPFAELNYEFLDEDKHILVLLKSPPPRLEPLAEL